MYAEFAELLNTAQIKPEIRVVLVSAAGDNYSAGNDLQDFLDHPPGSGDSSQKQLIDALRVFDKPLVGAVRGAAVGSGATMLTYFDFVVAGQGAGIGEVGVDRILDRRKGHGSFHVLAAGSCDLVLPRRSLQPAPRRWSSPRCENALAAGGEGADQPLHTGAAFAGGVVLVFAGRAMADVDGKHRAICLGLTVQICHRFLFRPVLLC
jgi:hypothetical protein